MADFRPFAAAVKAQFDRMAQSELFVVNIDGDELYAVYQAAFPPGTNEIYREKREHECSCCKNFIRNVGNVVSIVDGELVTVWDNWGDLEAPYYAVAQALETIVRGLSITGVFRTTEPAYGAESNVELRDGTVQTWNHFHATIPSTFYKGSNAAASKGEAAALFQVLNRGLIELRLEDIDTVIDLAQTNNLYRANEKLHMLTAFRELKTEFHGLWDTSAADIFVWANISSPAARLRNDVIGTLLQDLAEGKPLEQAVKSYEDKVSGTNYKRPTALITPRMVEDAMKTIQAEGLEPALERRFACIEDVSINDVLWADNSVKSLMKGGLTDMLMAETVKVFKIDASKAEDITIDDFLANVLPKAQMLDVIVRNSQQGNFMSITAPVHDDVQPLFKWNNNFAWSYDGNIADSVLRRQVQSLGGRVDGVLRFSHTWNYDRRNASLMDLHVFMPGSSKHGDGCHDRYPSGQRVGWNQRKDSASGGVQDVDYTNPAPEGYVPVENITFPDMSRLVEGPYTFKIHNWAFREPTKGGFRAEVEFAGQVYEYDHPEPLKNKEWVTLAVANLKAGVFSIEHKHAVGVSSQEKWGVTTEQPAKVSTVMLSPNYWNGEATGNRHVFFVLDGCKTAVPARGIYNEFLRPDLEKHRKVFEVLGNKTKCEPTDDQLSGVGFTSGRGDSVLVQVTGEKLRKLYNVKF